MTQKKVLQVFQNSPGFYSEHYSLRLGEHPLDVKKFWSEAELAKLEKTGVIVERIAPDGRLIPRPEAPSYTPPPMAPDFLKAVTGKPTEPTDKKAAGGPVLTEHDFLQNWLLRIKEIQDHPDQVCEPTIEASVMAKINQAISQRKAIGDPPQLRTSSKKDGPGNLASKFKKFFSVK